MMAYPLEIHVIAPDDAASADIVSAAVAAAIQEYRNVWGDHFSVSYSLAAGAVVPMVEDPNDTPETPLAHIWIVFIPND